MAANERRTSSVETVLEFVVRTAEILLVAAAFWIAAQLTGSLVLWGFAGIVACAFFAHIYVSIDRVIWPWMQRSITNEDSVRRGLGKFAAFFVLFQVVGSLALYGTISALSELVKANRVASVQVETLPLN
jgi:hypothetical protein